MRGKFIVVDGPDGCGKSTLARRLVHHLSDIGRNTFLEYEPTKNSFPGKLVREVVSENKYSFFSGETMIDLFRADRIEHSVEINNLLDAGINVVCDRYYLSTVVYQAFDICMEYKIEYDFQRLYHMENILIKMKDDPIVVPDLYIVLNANYDVLMDRVVNRVDRKIEDRYEESTKLNILSWMFRNVAEMDNMRKGSNAYVVKIDASKSEDGVFKEAMRFVEICFNKC